MNNLIANRRQAHNSAPQATRTTYNKQARRIDWGQVTVIEEGNLTSREVERIRRALGMEGQPDRERLEAYQFIRDLLAGQSKVNRPLIKSICRKPGAPRFLGARNVDKIIAALLNK